MKTRQITHSLRIPALAAALVVATLVVAIGGAASAARGSGPPAESTEAQRLRALELTRLQALVDGDVGTAGALLADDFQLVPPPGFPLSRDEYLGAVEAGALDYLVFEPVSPIDVRLYGQAAVMTYRSSIDIVAAGLGRFTHEVWHTYVWERNAGRWQVVWEQATGVGGFPPPAG
jgi:hypothetical protein